MSMPWIVALALVASGEAPATGKPEGEWRLTLAEAIRVGVANSPTSRVVGPEGARKDAGAMVVAKAGDWASPWDFKAAMTAHVRSIEQQYWALALQDIKVWAAESAVRIGEGILAHERAELAAGRDQKSDVAEAERALERFRLASIQATSDRITTERQLRNLLGLAPADNRRIVPATAPVEAKVEPVWEKCLAAMQENRPDIRLQREAVAAAEARAGAHTAKAPAPTGLPADVAEAVEAQEGRASVERQEDRLREVTHQATHTLARFFLEIDASYKQFQTARKLRQAAQERLKAARAAYDEGRPGFTIDRLLDAVAQYADAVGQEAMYKFSYNTAFAALEEAKGTLLAERKIVVADKPPAGLAPVVRVAREIVAGKVRERIGVDFDVKPASLSAQADAKPAPKAEETPAPPKAGRVIRYDIAVDGGPVPVQLKGTVTLGSPSGR